MPIAGLWIDTSSTMQSACRYGWNSLWRSFEQMSIQSKGSHRFMVLLPIKFLQCGSNYFERRLALRFFTNSSWLPPGLFHVVSLWCFPVCFVLGFIWSFRIVLPSGRFCSAVCFMQWLLFNVRSWVWSHPKAASWSTRAGLQWTKIRCSVSNQLPGECTGWSCFASHGLARALLYQARWRVILSVRF